MKRVTEKLVTWDKFGFYRHIYIYIYKYQIKGQQANDFPSEMK